MPSKKAEEPVKATPTKKAKAPSSGGKDKEKEGGKAKSEVPEKLTYAKLQTALKKVLDKIDKSAMAKVNEVFERYDVKGAISNQKKSKNPNAPKKEPTIYNIFCKWKMSEMDASLTQKEKMKKAGKMWTQEYKNNAAKMAQFKKANNIKD